jgi:hypothetical protein
MSVIGRRKDEHGAVAVLFAFLALVLLSISALAVDLGNTVARKTTTQTQADFAAFAAAQKLFETAPPAGTPVSATVVTEVRDYLNHNQPQDDEKPCSLTTPATCVSSAQLTDGTLTNGEVRWTSDGLQVVAPEARVDFGFAKVMGMDGTYVDADATVKIFSRGLRVMPMFAVSGCDYGRQTLTDPATGHAPPGGVPEITPNDSNPILNTATLKNSANADVTELALNSAGNMLTLTALGWDKSTAIGFFPDGATNTPAQAIPQGAFWLAGDATRADLSPDTKPTGMSDSDYAKLYKAPSATVQAMIPDTVAQTAGIWWVRVYNGPTSAGNPTSAGKWSREALPIRVGGAVLECVPGSVGGNFGTLKLPRTDVSSALDLPVNIAVGLQKPLTPSIHQWAKDNPLLAGTCTEGINGAVESSGDTDLQPGTNCVDTDTGLAANVATQGLITGAGGNLGALNPSSPMGRGTKAGCDPTGGNANRPVTLNHVNYQINNDVLTCYLTDSSTSLATISNASYNGPPVLSADIFSSPRFIWVPVMAIQPDSGGSLRYSIIDFRPAFITDEESTSAAIKGSHTATSDNGLTIPSNDITEIKVVFFDIDALTNEGDTPLIDYLGVGQRVVNLID